jgi:hypothetical protein
LIHIQDKLKRVGLLSESQFQAKLNVARRSRGRDGAKSRISQVVFEIAEVGTVKSIEDVSLKLQFESLV